MFMLDADTWLTLIVDTIIVVRKRIGSEEEIAMFQTRRAFN